MKRSLVVAALAAAAASPAWAQEAPFCTADLASSGGVQVGSVSVARLSETVLRVTYNATDPWQVTENQLSVALSPAGFPQTAHGCPYPCQFAFSQILPNPAASHTFDVDIDPSKVPSGSTLYFAARALVSPQPGAPTPSACIKPPSNGGDDRDGDDGRHCGRQGSGHGSGDHRYCQKIEHSENDGLHCSRTGDGHSRGDHRNCQKDPSHVYSRNDDGRHCSQTGYGHGSGDHRNCQKLEHSENDGRHCAKPGSGHGRGDHGDCLKDDDGGPSSDDGKHCTRQGSGHGSGDHRYCTKIEHSEADGLHCSKTGYGHARGDHSDCEKDGRHVHSRSDDGKHCSRTGYGHSSGDHRNCTKVEHSDGDGRHCTRPSPGHSRGDHDDCEKERDDDNDGGSSNPRLRTEGSCATCVRPPSSSGGNDGNHCTRPGSGHDSGDHRYCQEREHGENDGLHCSKTGYGHSRGDHRNCEKDGHHVYSRSDDGMHCAQAGSGHASGDHRYCRKVEHSDRDGMHCSKPASGHASGDHRYCVKDSAGRSRSEDGRHCTSQASGHASGDHRYCQKIEHSDGDGLHCVKTGYGHSRGDHRYCEKDANHTYSRSDDGRHCSRTAYGHSSGDHRYCQKIAHDDNDGRHCTKPSSGHSSGNHRDCEKEGDDDDNDGGSSQACSVTAWGGDSPFACSNGATYFACTLPPSDVFKFTKQFASPAQFGGVSGTFTLTVENTGTTTIDQIDIADAIDPRFSFTPNSVSIPNGAGSCTVDGQSLSCNVHGLQKGELVTVTVTYIAAPVEEQVEVTNCATATSRRGATAESCSVVLLSASGPG
jgi:uncharacterized repeat protein (TIGR01451 family)